MPLAYQICLSSGRQCCGAWPVMVNSTSSGMFKPSCFTLNSKDLPIQRKKGKASFIAVKYFWKDARPRTLGWFPQELNYRERADFLGKWSPVPVSWAPRQSNWSCRPGSGCCPLTPGPGAQADPGRPGPWVGTQPGDGHTAQQDVTWGHRLMAE